MSSLRPTRPRGTSKKAILLQWLYDARVENQARQSAGMLTTQTTRGVFRRMIPQSSSGSPVPETPFRLVHTVNLGDPNVGADNYVPEIVQNGIFHGLTVGENNAINSDDWKVVMESPDPQKLFIVPKFNRKLNGVTVRTGLFKNKLVRFQFTTDPLFVTAKPSSISLFLYTINNPSDWITNPTRTITDDTFGGVPVFLERVAVTSSNGAFFTKGIQGGLGYIVGGPLTGIVLTKPRGGSNPSGIITEFQIPSGTVVHLKDPRLGLEPFAFKYGIDPKLVTSDWVPQAVQPSAQLNVLQFGLGVTRDLEIDVSAFVTGKRMFYFLMDYADFPDGAYPPAVKLDLKISTKIK